MTIPLLAPRLPDAYALLPYLQKIDGNRYYSNFGPLTRALEARLSAWFEPSGKDCPHIVTCASATLGLELAISSLNLQPGSRILLPALTFIASASAILRCGHIPVVADVDAATWLLTPEIADTALACAKFDAVMPVASFGLPQDPAVWHQWQTAHGIPVIIDAAGAFGSQMHVPGITVVFSLHATKTLAAGEGGFIIAADERQATKLRALTNFGIYLADHAPESMPPIGQGTNAKLSEYHAAVALASLDVWPIQARQRNELACKYQSNLQLACHDLMTFQGSQQFPSPTLMPVLFQSPQLRRNVEAKCTSRGIGTRRWYTPLIHKHPALQGVEVAHPTPRADHIESCLLGLPFFIDMSDEQLTAVTVTVGFACAQAIAPQAAASAKITPQLTFIER